MIWFVLMAVLLGILADIIIDKTHIFGNALNKYYRLPKSYLWGFIAYLFALFIALICYQLIV